MNWTALEHMRVDLDDNRVKRGVDYAFTHKYGKTHVVCDGVWVKAIKAAAKRHGVTIDTWHTYYTNAESFVCPYGAKWAGCTGNTGPWCGYCQAESK
jgi:hypothetical protein